MTSTPFHRISGTLALAGTQPDGDSIRFHPEHPRALHALEHSGALRFSADGGVQLRLEGIDAPELHYRGAAQPQGEAARSVLLALAGFDEERFRRDRKTVDASTPVRVPAVIVARDCDLHGRPIAYLYASYAVALLDKQVAGGLGLGALRSSLNAALVHTGAAYPLAYDTQPAKDRACFAALARHARTAGHGVWAHDRTKHGLPLEEIARTTRAPLVLPKLFRRVVDFLGAREHAFDGSILDWLGDPSTGASENDALVVHDGQPTRLREVLALRGDRVGLTVDPIDVTYVSSMPRRAARTASTASSAL